MKKSLKISILSIITFLTICGIFLFSLPNIFSTHAEITEETEGVSVIKTAQELQDFVKNYQDTDAESVVLLTADIDMSGYTLNGTIGTETNPFSGTFDGNGHTISNLTFSFTDIDNDVPSYIGLFGVTSGASIFDLGISETTTVTVANSPNVLDIGVLVGSAENGTSIENVSINSTLNYIDQSVNNSSINENNRGLKTINAGGMVGELKNSTIQNSFFRLINSVQENAMSFTLSSIFRRDAKFGGIAGAITNSSVMFVVSMPFFDIDISENFAGTTYVGGIFGTISQGNSKVINCVVEPTISVSNASSNTVYSGAVGGYITLPAPTRNNISYIYYNSSLSAFGDSTNYSSNSTITSVSDTITTHLDAENHLDAEDYFTSKSWNGLYGDHWDFANTFIIEGNNISLQAFQDEFLVRVATSSVSLDENIIILLDEYGNNATDNELEIRRGYNDTVEINFKFNASVSDLIGQYYSLSNLTLRSNTSGETRSVASFNELEVDDEDEYRYRLDSVANYERIFMSSSTVDSETVYTITINGITNNYTGLYQLNVTANEFVGRFEYRLFDKNDNLVDELAKTECYVYNKTGGNQTSSSYTINDITYNNSYTIATNANSRSIYEFRGWYLDVGNDGVIEGDTPLSSPDEAGVYSNSDLNVTFGQDDFALTENFVVYAKYVDNSCSLNFDFNEGVERIVISTNENAITEIGSISVRKQSNVKLEVYLKDNYTFDAQRFLAQFNTFTGFCERVDDGSNPSYFQFNLDLTQLNDPSFNDQLNLTFETEYNDTTDWTMIWIIVGSVLGGLVLIAVIVIIVVVVKRRGGGGRGGKISKSSYKNMYY